MFHSKILKSGNTIDAVPRSIFLISQFLNNDHDMAIKMYFFYLFFLSDRNVVPQFLKY